MTYQPDDEFAQSLKEFCKGLKYLTPEIREECGNFKGSSPWNIGRTPWNKGLVDWEKRAARKQWFKDRIDPRRVDPGRNTRIAAMTEEEKLEHRRDQYRKASKAYRERKKHGK